MEDHFMILFLLSLISCHKPLNHQTARHYFANTNCVETLKYHMGLAGCDKMQVEQESEVQWLVRCYKPDKERGEFWDNYVFRISPSVALYDPEDMAVVDEHTICIDEGIRIEAYDPTK